MKILYNNSVCRESATNGILPSYETKWSRLMKGIIGVNAKSGNSFLHLYGQV